ncbi:MAG: hypothetical protein GY694_00865 [Gammaproteobacteria bacterium]|nr:hypothetical protein [Gammaproteobacteria bacterium]
MLLKLLLFTSIVWSLITFEFLYAAGQYDQSPYKGEYHFPPPMQKPGSNPLTDRKRQYLIIQDNNVRDNFSVKENHYTYPPPVQKAGSNPFLKPGR